MYTNSMQVGMREARQLSRSSANKLRVYLYMFTLLLYVNSKYSILLSFYNLYSYIQNTTSIPTKDDCVEQPW